jgi:hypothetical protein
MITLHAKMIAAENTDGRVRVNPEQIVSIHQKENGWYVVALSNGNHLDVENTPDNENALLGFL